MPGRGTTKRSYRCEDEVYLPAKARAEAEGLSVSELIVALLLAYGRRETSGGRPARPVQHHDTARAAPTGGSSHA